MIFMTKQSNETFFSYRKNGKGAKEKMRSLNFITKGQQKKGFNIKPQEDDVKQTLLKLFKGNCLL